MTDTDLPPMPPMPPVPPNDPPRPAKKSRTHLVIIGSAAAVIAAVVATGVVVVQSGTVGTKPATTAESNVDDTDAVTADAPDPGPTYSQVDADSFAVGLKTTARQCFGTAGCTVTVEPDLTFLGDSEGIDPDAVYEITYEIHGDESGPVIETAELSNRTNLNYTQSVISTASAGTEVTADITDVSLQGG